MLYGRAAVARGIIFGILSGFIVLLLIYGAFVTERTKTGKISALMVNYSTFSYIIGFIVILMALMAIMHKGKSNRFV